MSFFPADFDPRDDVAGLLRLVEIGTPDGPQRFLIGVDADFTDLAGNVWHGSSLLSVSGMEMAIGGVAPSGDLTLGYIQPSGDADLIAQIKALGSDYIDGEPVTFYVQPIRAISEFYAPASLPIQMARRTARTITYNLTGARDRHITLSFETVFEARSHAPRIIYNTEGHAKLIGEANPSLEFMPTVNWEEEPIWG